MKNLGKILIAVVLICGSFYLGFSLKEGVSDRGMRDSESSNTLFESGTGSVASITGPVTGSGKVIAVYQGDSIQAAVGEAEPGDIVAVYPGTYNETIYIDKDSITLSGVIVDGEWPILDGELEKNDAVLYSGNNIIVENLTIRRYKGNGVMGQAGNNFVIRNNIVDDTGVYGIFPQYGKNGVIANNVLSGISDAAIYVGMSDNIDVINNEVFDSVAGIEIENTRHALVEGNYTHDNTGGILVFITPGLPIKTTYDVIVRRNFIVNNNTPNFGAPGSTVAGIPAGTGIIVMAGDDVVIEDNIISGNNTAGIIITDLNFQKMSKDPESEPNTDRLMMLNNVMYNNGNDPQAEVKALMATQLKTRGPDFLDTGSAKGEDKCILNGERYRSYGLEKYFQCDYAKMTSLAINTMTLPEPAEPFKLVGESAENYEYEVGRHTYYAICSGCHLDKGVLIGPSVEEIQETYMGDLTGLSDEEIAEIQQIAAESIAFWINEPSKVRENSPEMPPQNYLSESTRIAAAKYMLSRNKKLPMLRDDVD